MGDPLKKVQPGARLRIPAAAYNAFVDAAKDLQSRQLERSQEASGSSRSSGIVLVKNASGSDCVRFGVLGVDKPLYGPADNADSFKNQVVLSGVTPTADHAGKFVILLEPLKAGSIGSALAAGAGVVQVDVKAAADTLAEVAPGQTASLISGSSGSCTTLWKEVGTGTKWAIVRFGGGAGAAPQALPPAGRQYTVLTAVTDYNWGVDVVRAHGPYY